MARGHLQGRSIAGGGARRANQRMSRELVANGSFADGTGWTLPAEVTIAGGVMTFGNVTATRTPTTPIGAFPIGARFRVSFDVTDVQAGGVFVTLGAKTSALRQAVGSYSQDIQTVAASNLVGVRANIVGTIASVDNFSVRRLA